MESESLGKDVSSKWQPEKSGVAVPTSDKMDFKLNTVARNKEGPYIMIKAPATKRYIGA